MTFEPPAAAPFSSPDARAILADEATRRRILAFVRKRVPAQDADDVVQAVLCDALAATPGGVPTAPEDLARWLAGVARHKAADLHRERARRPQAEGVDVEAFSAPPSPMEARSLLRAVEASAARDRHGAEALDWVVREAQGERLDHMAQEAALEPAAVRQRVSRLRRLLRQRWLREALLVAAATSVLLCARGTFVGDGRAPIVAEPAGSGDERLLAALQGEWRLESAEPGGRAASIASVRVGGSTLSFVSPLRHVERAIRVEARGEGRFDLTIYDGRDQRGAVRASGAFDGPDRIVVDSDDAAWRGRAVLVR